MATRLQQLLDELKELSEDEDVILPKELNKIIAKYTETTSTYKPGDKILITKSCLKTFNGTKGYLVELHSKEEKLWKVKHFLGMCYFSEEEFEPIN